MPFKRAAGPVPDFRCQLCDSESDNVVQKFVP